MHAAYDRREGWTMHLTSVALHRRGGIETGGNASLRMNPVVLGSSSARVRRERASTGSLLRSLRRRLFLPCAARPCAYFPRSRKRLRRDCPSSVEFWFTGSEDIAPRAEDSGLNRALALINDTRSHRFAYQPVIAFLARRTSVCVHRLVDSFSQG